MTEEARIPEGYLHQFLPASAGAPTFSLQTFLRLVFPVVVSFVGVIGRPVAFFVFVSLGAFAVGAADLLHSAFRAGSFSLRAARRSARAAWSRLLPVLPLSASSLPPGSRLSPGSGQ